MAEQKPEQELELSGKVKELVEAIKSLSVMELVQLVKALESAFGVSAIPVAAPAASLAGAPAAAGGGAPAPQEEAGTKTYKVILKEAGPNKLQVIKEIRAILPDLNIKQAKDFVEALPKTVKEGVPENEAKELKERLERVGAKVELVAG